MKKQADLVTLKAYACTACGKAYPTTPLKWMAVTDRKKYREQARAFAAACCTCPQCHGKCDRYHGRSDKLCSTCREKNEREHSVKSLEQALVNYERVCQLHGVRNASVDDDLCRIVDAIRERAKGRRQ